MDAKLLKELELSFVNDMLDGNNKNYDKFFSSFLIDQISLEKNICDVHPYLDIVYTIYCKKGEKMTKEIFDGLAKLEKKWKMFYLQYYNKLLFKNGMAERKTPTYIKATNVKTLAEDIEIDQSNEDDIEMNYYFDNNDEYEIDITGDYNKPINLNDTNKKKEERVEEFDDKFLKQAEKYFNDITTDSELCKEYSKDKLSLHMFDLLIRLHTIMNDQVYKTQPKKGMQYMFPLIYKYKFDDVIYKSKRDIYMFNLKETHDAIIQLCNNWFIIFKMKIVIPKNRTVSKTKKILLIDALLAEVNMYVSFIFMRVGLMMNKLWKSKSLMINHMEFIKLINYKKDGKNYKKKVCNMYCLMFFSHMYRSIISCMDIKGNYFPKYKVVKYGDKFALHHKIQTNFNKFIESISEAEPQIQYEIQCFIEKSLVIVGLQDYFIWEKWFKNEGNMQTIKFLIIRQNKLQKDVLGKYQPGLYDWMCENVDNFEDDLRQYVTFSRDESAVAEQQLKIYNDLLSDKKIDEVDKTMKISKTLVYRYQVKIPFTIKILDIWFKMYKTYNSWMFRFVVPLEGVMRYSQYIEKVKYPIIIQSDVLRYDVVYKGKYYACDNNVIKAITKWYHIILEDFKGYVMPFGKDMEFADNLLNFCPWVYVWKRAMTNRIDLKKFFIEISTRKININRGIFNVSEKTKNDINRKKKKNGKKYREYDSKNRTNIDELIDKYTT